MIGVGAAKGSAAETGSRTGVRDGNGESEEISTGCGETTVSVSGPCAPAYAIVTKTTTDVSAKCLKLKAEKIFINDLCPIRISSLWTCTFALGFEKGNGPEVSLSVITKATGDGVVFRE